MVGRGRKREEKTEPPMGSYHQGMLNIEMSLKMDDRHPDTCKGSDAQDPRRHVPTIQ